MTPPPRSTSDPVTPPAVVDDPVAYVIKRNGDRQEVNFDAIWQRLWRLAQGKALIHGKEVAIGVALPHDVAMTVAQRTIAGLVPGTHTSEIDDQSTVLSIKSVPLLSCANPDQKEH
jgi:hypothetical protein